MTTKFYQNVNGISQRVEGFYRVLVVDATTKEIVWEQPEFKHNLILNQGMDGVATHLWADLFLYGVAGTGTRVNSVDSAGDTAAQSGTTVTNAGGINFSTQAAAGDMIQFSGGAEARITSVTGPTQVEVTPGQSVGSSTYIIWKTAQIGLQTEIKRSNTYLPGSGNCETTLVSNTLQMRRTYDFTAEVGTVNYTEVGVAWAASVSTTVFSRILLAAPVAINAGQQLRLVYQLNVTLTPAVSNSKSLPVGGWPVAPATGTVGSECIQNLNISAVNTTGSTYAYGSGPGAVLDPASTLQTGSQGRNFAISTNSSALAAFGSAANRTTTAYMPSNYPSNAVYVPLSFLLDCTIVFAVADAVSSSIRSFCLGFGNTPYNSSWQSFTFLFNEAQTKTNTQTLTITVRFSWSRVLA